MMSIAADREPRARNFLGPPLDALLALAAGWLTYVVAAATDTRHVALQTAACAGTMLGTAMVASAIVGLGSGTRRYRQASLIFAAALSGAALALFRHTSYGLNALASDAQFATAAIAKAQAYLWPTDFYYKGLSAYYPPLYPQVVGKLGSLMGYEAALAGKLGAIASLALIPSMLFFAWRRIANAPEALLVAVLSTAPAVMGILWKPGHSISVLLFVPFWVGLHGLGDRPLADRRRLALTALAGAALFTTYYYPFFVGACALLVGAVETSLSRMRPSLGTPRGVVVCLALSALLSSWYWLPLSMDISTIDFGATQTRWFRPSHLPLPLLGGLSWGTAMSWVGIFYLVLAKGPIDTVLRRLLLGALLWAVVGLSALGWEHPLLVTRTWSVVTAICAVGAARAIMVAVARFDLPVARVVAAALLIAGGFAAQGLIRVGNDGKMKTSRKAAHKRPYRELTAMNAALQGKTILVNDIRVPVLTGLYVLLSHKVHSSHPSAQYEERFAFVRALAKQKDGSFVCHMLRHNRFGTVDLVRAGKEFGVLRDAFPNGTKTSKIRMEPEAFDAPCFRQPSAELEKALPGVSWVTDPDHLDEGHWTKAQREIHAEYAALD